MDVIENVAANTSSDRHMNGASHDMDVKQSPLRLNVPVGPQSRWKFEINTDALQFDGQENIVLVLGDPNEQTLYTLLRSPHLSSYCLFIVATNTLPIPLSTLSASLKEWNPLSTFCLLRLSTELALYEDGKGATRLIRVLERAQEIARLWRKADKSKTGGSVEEFYEDLDSVVESGGNSRRQSIFRNNNSTSTSLLTSAARPPSSSIKTLSRKPSKLFGSRETLFSGSQKTLSILESTRRTIDTIIHILPLHEAVSSNSRQLQHPHSSRRMQQPLTDKSLLKSVVLATTLSRPFLLDPGEDRDRTNAFEKSNSSPPPSFRHYKSHSFSASQGQGRYPSTTSRKPEWVRLQELSSSAASFGIEEEDDQQLSNMKRLHSISRPPVPNRAKTVASSNPSSATEKTAEINSWMKILTEQNAKIVHVLPSYDGSTSLTNPLVIRRLESFLLMFCSSNSGDKKKDTEKGKGKEHSSYMTTAQLRAGMGKNRIIPFLIDLSLFSSKIPIPQSLSPRHTNRDVRIIDLIISGSLDGRSAFDGHIEGYDYAGVKLKDVDYEKGSIIQRAWISDLGDIDFSSLVKAYPSRDSTIKFEQTVQVMRHQTKNGPKTRNESVISLASEDSETDIAIMPKTIYGLPPGAQAPAVFTGSASSILQLNSSKELLAMSTTARPRTASSLNSHSNPYPSLHILSDRYENHGGTHSGVKVNINEPPVAHLYHHTRSSDSLSPFQSSPSFIRPNHYSLSSAARPQSEFGGYGYADYPTQSVMAETGRGTRMISSNDGLEDTKPGSRLTRGKSKWNFWRKLSSG